MKIDLQAMNREKEEKETCKNFIKYCTDCDRLSHFCSTLSKSMVITIIILVKYSGNKIVLKRVKIRVTSDHTKLTLIARRQAAVTDGHGGS